MPSRTTVTPKDGGSWECKFRDPRRSFQSPLIGSCLEPALPLAPRHGPFTISEVFHESCSRFSTQRWVIQISPPGFNECWPRRPLYLITDGVSITAHGPY